MKKFKYLLFIAAISLVAGITACKKDEEPEMRVEEPRARFTPTQDQNNPFTYSFVNESINADSYAWEFGDGNTASTESPSHTYAGEGTYTVKLTATGAGGTHSSSSDVTVVDPNAELKKLTGESSKVWKLSRDVDGMEYPLQVGPADRSQIWWAYGLNDPIGSRPCIMEEEYVFGLDGSFAYDTKGSVFSDYGIWNAAVEGKCVDDTDETQMINVENADLRAWGAGSFTYDFDPAAGTLTLNGLGAHVGLPKVGTTAEFNVPQQSVTYKVTKLETDGAIDKMVLETELTAAGGYWQFSLVSYDNPADEPELPGAPPTVAFTHEISGSTVTFTNNSTNTDSYMWDFGDGNTSMDASPSHTYSTDGNYTVTLTGTNQNGTADATVNIVIATNSVFSAAVVHGDASKTWKLKPVAGALGVGPTKGSGEWFATTADDVTVRACTFDDQYIFGSDNAFQYVTNGDVWGESYMGVDPAACVAENTLSAAAMPWGAGNHTFTVTEATGNDPAYITVTGTGAFIGLPKAFNGGEYQGPTPTVDGSVKYEVLSYVNDGTTETIVLTIDISEGQAGGAYWNFILVAE